MDKKKRRFAGRLKFTEAETGEVKSKIIHPETGAESSKKSSANKPTAKPDGKKPIPESAMPDGVSAGVEPAAPKPVPDGRIKFVKDDKLRAAKKPKSKTPDRKAGKTVKKADKPKLKRDKTRIKQPTAVKPVIPVVFEETAASPVSAHPADIPAADFAGESSSDITGNTHHSGTGAVAVTPSASITTAESGTPLVKKPAAKKPAAEPVSKKSAPVVDVPDGSPIGGAPTDPKPVRGDRLKFTKEEKRGAKETAKTEKLDGKAGNTEKKADKYTHKRDKYHDKQPTRKKRVKERYFDDKSGKAKTRLRFEKEIIPINEAKWNKPKKKSVPRKAVSGAMTAGVNKLHSKVYEVEHENVGTQAGHKAELLSESAFRGGKKVTRAGYRFVRNTPYRREAKFEVKSIKTRSKLEYQKALRDNPKLRSNPLSRMWQKRSIKKQYSDALKTAKKSGKTTKKAASAVKKTGAAITKLIRKNPILLLKAGLLLLIIMMMMALFSMCATLFSGGSGFVGAAAYAAEDVEIEQAELSYTEWETDLLMEALNAETSHSGYDECRYNIGSVGHSPIELIGFLTAVYEDFTYAGVESVLRDIFNEQYQLTFTPEIEIRKRMETRTGTNTDPETGVVTEYEYEVEVEYEWHILNVVLTARTLSYVINPRMNAEQLEHIAILKQSRGARQFVGNPFDVDALPYVSSYYGYRVHPITGVKDLHRGLDIAMPEGTEIRAGLDGKVTTAAFDSGYGNYVVIETTMSDGSVVETKYAHCHTMLVSSGQTVSAGDIIATVGNTGSSTGAHLHMEVVKDGVYMNPLFYVVTHGN